MKAYIWEPGRLSYIPRRLKGEHACHACGKPFRTKGGLARHHRPYSDEFLKAHPEASNPKCKHGAA